MKTRLKCIDIFRGYVIIYMILLHTWMWGIPGGAPSLSTNSFFHLLSVIILYVSPEAEGFVFVSGISIMLSYQMKSIKAKNAPNFNQKDYYKEIRLKYFLQALFLFLIGFFYYNFRAFLYRGYIGNLWSWNIFQTLAVSIILAWPLMKYKKNIRVLIASIFLILYGIFFYFIPKEILISPSDQIVITSVIDFVYFIFYNGFLFTPILGFFPFFLLGNVLGEIIYEKIIDENTKITNKEFIRSNIYPLLLISALLIIISLLFIPIDNFSRNSFSWLLYSLGTNFIFFLILLSIEIRINFNFKREYKFFFYFSYYSLTILILHEFLFPLLYQKFTISQGFFISLIIIIFFFIGLKIIYQNVGKYFSLKYLISELSFHLAISFNKRRILKLKK